VVVLVLAFGRKSLSLVPVGSSCGSRLTTLELVGFANGFPAMRMLNKMLSLAANPIGNSTMKSLGTAELDLGLDT